MKTRSLPRLVTWLLRIAAGPMADEVEGDLYEWMARWREDSGPVRAWLRGLLIALVLVVRLAVGRLFGAVRGGTFGSGLSLDAKLALRLMWRNPALSLISVVALAITMGLAISLFTVNTASLYSDLPVPDGDRIVVLDLRDRVTRERLIPTYGEYRAWAEGTTTMDHAGGYSVSRLNVGREDVPVQATSGAWVTPSIFQFNPTIPLIGTLFTDEMVAENPDVVLLGEEVWRARFGGDPAVLGSLVDVNGTAHEIVGVIPDSWKFPSDEDVWVPLLIPVGAQPDDQHPDMRLVGRLAEGVSAARATAESDALIRGGSSMADRETSVVVRGYARGFTDPAEIPLFWGAVSAMVMLVLVAAANVANLVLARTEARRSELSVRSALGASRRRIIGQLFIEALALTAVAAVIAVTLSNWGLSWMETLVPGLPYYMDLSPSPVVIGFAAGLAGMAAVLAGVVPGLRSTRGGMAEGVRSSRNVGFGRFSQFVIVAEIAVSVALLGTAFAVGQSFVGYTRGSVTQLADEEILTATLYTPWEGDIVEEFEIEEFSSRLQQGIRDQLSRTPGVRAGFTLDLPGTEAQTSQVEIEGAGEGQVHPVRGVSVDDGFFEVVNVRADPGRVFQPSDFQEGAARAFLVNQPFVDEIMEGRNVLGQRLRFHYGDGTQSEWGEVIGVVPDLGMNPGDPTAAAAVYRAMPGTNYSRVVVRGAGVDPFTLVPALREAAFEVDPRSQIRDPRLLRDAARDERALLSGLGAGFFLLGAMALLLSSAGVYAVISFGVSSRTREIGVRVALGADTRRVIQSIGARVARNLMVGLLIGVAIGWGMLQAVGMLELTIRVNPIVHLGAPALLLMLSGLLAVWKPLSRALAIQPAEALRSE